VKLVCMAFLNPSKLADLSLLFVAYFLVNIPWDAEEYYLECIKGKKDRKRIRFPNPQFGMHSEPLTVVDSRGRIVLWYLPGLLSGHYQVSGNGLCFVSVHYQNILTLHISWMFSEPQLA
jgi:hypothetical protein